MEYNEIKVGIADLNVAFSPNKLITVGLGSCIGIAIYDKAIGIGGLAHIMLPDSSQFNKITNEIKFADLAIPILVEKMIKKGATLRNMRAKIAGGASMFNFPDKSIIMDIGNRNGIAVKSALKNLSIPILSEDIGGNKGRTLIFDTTSGALSIRTVGMGTVDI
ncbi:chemotaxis protein CheD [Clostridium tagluense]|uniref:chemotaxis protein CheD n=1 Tax=Clostridium TaxID=1485 RepID=UPI0013E971D9|nr:MULTISPECIES: chemotaxis protein CheD [Clostridium]MBW9154986.1 chemotaxis protein CheD [Clostridium tagluense]MBZ9624598.1 chemotaxis protein CheD [Clostridium sp. FP2]MCB2310055.1 chemotaxis protein CheD [Clostridium tagluense]MCB2314415.1 chemotaxis protein CheD [Clostridium tagluense]MCB2319261.1 chemotaxis protein CheD [Clostridium tagluense]